ncbi:type I-E CRISPR-associated protein Cse2/CasB [Streptomyces sp. NPDC086989]|uniref:type I-E CRISPR-associated protein Cse2/CasB n=1 Tax=Streptomyces sp. NPDC086989 TaxID=3365764 RepID=UPI0037F64BC3
MSTTTDTNTSADAEPESEQETWAEQDPESTRAAPPSEHPPAEQLARWLVSLVHNRDNGTLAELRRPRAKEDAHIRAGWYAPVEEQREIYERVAFLFAVYHQGADRPHKGYDTLGGAMRRIGSRVGRGPKDAGASRLNARIVSSRSIPWRHLQHAVARLRSCEQGPPAWSLLVDDLVRWTDREAKVRYRWAVDFHTPWRATKTAARKTAAPTKATSETLARKTSAPTDQNAQKDATT